MSHFEAYLLCYLLLLMREANLVQSVAARGLIGTTAYGLALLVTLEAPMHHETGLLTIGYGLLVAEEAHLVPSTIVGLSRATIAYATMAAISFVLLLSGPAY